MVKLVHLTLILFFPANDPFNFALIIQQLLELLLDLRSKNDYSIALNGVDATVFMSSRLSNDLSSRYSSR